MDTIRKEIEELRKQLLELDPDTAEWLAVAEKRRSALLRLTEQDADAKEIIYGPDEPTGGMR